VGQWIGFEEQQHEVVGFVDTGVRLRSRDGHMQIIVTAVCWPTRASSSNQSHDPANTTRARATAA
jgi:hypothetical protein